MNRRSYRNSIVSDVVLRIISATAVFSLLLAVVLYFQIRSTMVYVQNEAMGEQVRKIASYIEIRPDGRVVHDMPDSLRERYGSAAGEGLQYLVVDAAGKKIFSSKQVFFDPFEIVPEDDGDPRFFEMDSPEGQKLLGAGIKRTFGGREFIVYAARSEQSIRSFTDFLVNTFIYKAALVGVPLILLLMVVVVVTLKKGFAPLEKISREVKAINYDNINVSIEEDGLPVEILPIVRAINRALSRLKRGIENQKEFTANAAHEMRTPLAIIKARIERLENVDDAGLLSEDVDDMTRLVNQMLDISMLDASEDMQMSPVDLTEIARSVCVDLGPLFISGGRAVKLEGGQSENRIEGNREGIYRALRNLVENAIKYSKPGGAIRVVVSHEDIRVIDGGPVIDQSVRDDIFRRFYRTAGSRQKSGAGLGLSIAGKVMELHKGRLYIDTKFKSGNCFVLAFDTGRAAHAVAA